MITLARRKAEIPAPRSGVIIPFTVGDDEPDLQTVYDRYRAVSSRVAPDLVTTPDVAYARSALIRALLHDGWLAPEIVHQRLRADEEILRPALLAAS